MASSIDCIFTVWETSDPKKMKFYDLLWKKSETNGKARWERIGTLIDKGNKKAIKLDMMPISKDSGRLACHIAKARKGRSILIDIKSLSLSLQSESKLVPALHAS